MREHVDIYLHWNIFIGEIYKILENYLNIFNRIKDTNIFSILDTFHIEITA